MNRALNFLGGIGLGLGFMYLADPDRGKRRRALLRDQLAHFLNVTDDAIGKTAEDLGNRTEGLLAEARSALGGEEVSDDVLVARVRAKMGRYVSHPHAVKVMADNGKVTLQGAILAAEVNDMLGAIASLRGVHDLTNELDVYKEADDIPSLQGQATPPGEPFELMQANWSPTARLIVGVAGGLVASRGLRDRGLLGLTLGAIGTGMLARSLTNMEVGRLLGLSDGRGAVSFHKTISVNAPVDRVFRYWTNLGNLPRFMEHLQEVKDLGEGRYRWVAVGPAGQNFEWEAVVTKMVPNQVLAWRSVKGATVGNAGIIHFASTPEGGTRLDIQMSYTPPAGGLGHMVAALFGADPKRALDEDLVRFKSLIEQGKTSAHKKTVESKDVEPGTSQAA
ncbi:MAG: SRPBCC family protein [Chloroflexota bacterium]